MYWKLWKGVMSWVLTCTCATTHFLYFPRRYYYGFTKHAHYFKGEYAFVCSGAVKKQAKFSRCQTIWFAFGFHGEIIIVFLESLWKKGLIFYFLALSASIKEFEGGSSPESMLHYYYSLGWILSRKPRRRERGEVTLLNVRVAFYDAANRQKMAAVMN